MKALKYILVIILTFSIHFTFSQELKVDTNKSSLVWLGKKANGNYYGTVKLKEGKLVWGNKEIETGEFIIDMSTITNTDTGRVGFKSKMEAHLKSEDFFYVDRYPTAKLEIIKSSQFFYNEGIVEANLTIKGITHPIKFKTKKEKNTFKAEIIVDRTKYNVRYGSDTYFDKLGDKIIFNEFTITVYIVTL